MTLQIADRVNSFAESQTLGMAKLGRELASKGHKVINLSLGEPDFDTPQHIKEAAIQAIHDNYTHYTPVAGFLDLREAVCSKFSRENNLTFTPDQVVVSTGAKQSLMNVVLSIVNPGDEVVIPAPFWVSYASMVEFAGGKPVLIYAGIEQDFKVTAEQIEAHITPKTKLMMFSSPCNPSGSVYNRAEMEAIAAMLDKYPQVYVVSDEIYEHINYVGKHESLASFENLRERSIVVNGVSKAYAMTGWRIGYIGAPKPIAAACEKLQGQFTSGTNSIAQRAAIAALSQSIEPTLQMCNTFHQRRNLVLELMKNISGFKCNVPDGAFYVFPEVSDYFGKKYENTTIQTATDLSMFILEHAHVTTVTGEAFGCNNNLRLSYAAGEADLKEAFTKIEQALAKLK
ncbi:pyridoxal phosphate-dependent aminotransferase [Oscillatoria amoena NRMC-F 0135]|nr:pyridoxal phosphate-dependent aminotransferase [Oscillatoria amoena NRMC-F 0135]